MFPNTRCPLAPLNLLSWFCISETFPISICRELLFLSEPRVSETLWVPISTVSLHLTLRALNNPTHRLTALSQPLISIFSQADLGLSFDNLRSSADTQTVAMCFQLQHCVRESA
ncbi:hypothetical protein BDR26DRAFT_687336 [Obelidium mucronatum]|nr:hypothetical protein BDR26DRAFT_687336 [Obelidium mucronatum]